ncbi:hypothetical protein B0H11DRAFT_1717361 [Mycena galericulata]|nr:hypothetical protein B0H11DRAFT_1717361 [Mycena galericulata]
MDVEPAPTGTHIETTPQRNPELWFEDGNIVIQAGNSQFRVHRGILAARSPVFQDMLAFPQPPDSELVEGCPLVRLPDSAAEVTVFLKAIFEPEFFRPFPFLTEFDIVIGCLRLSHKYGVDYLRRRALIHLSSAYHTTLSASDKSTYEEDQNSNRPAMEITSWSWPKDHIYNIYAIQIAREVGALWILPSVFYNLSDGSISNLGRTCLHGAVYNGVHTSLSIQDQEGFLNGNLLQNRSTLDVLRFLSHPMDIEGCYTPTQCATARLSAVRQSVQMIRSYPSIPIDIWEDEDWGRLEEVCPVCLAVLRETHEDARQAFWDKLPEMYGLPSWEKLEKMKIDAIGTDWLS